MVPARDLDSAPIIGQQVLSSAVHICQCVWQKVAIAIDNANETHEFMVTSSDGCFVRVRVLYGKSKNGDRVKAIQMIILRLSQVWVMLRLNVGRHCSGWSGILVYWKSAKQRLKMRADYVKEYLGVDRCWVGSGEG